MMQENSSQVALETRNLAIGYVAKGQGNSCPIATGLNLKLQRGELVCLLGANGAGKSTLIRVLCGMQEPMEGSVSIGSQSLAHLSPKEKARKISIALTDPLSVGMLSVYALVSLGRHPHTRWMGSLSAEDHRIVQLALKAVDCAALASRQVMELSDGERQKAMVARALAQEAPIMLLDEPTAYLDVARRVELMRILRDLAHEQNLAILLSTHDLDLALRCADRLWLFGEEGVLQGRPEALALDGKIASSFASEGLDWDHAQGSFRLHREPCVFVDFAGEGAAATWTRRLLTRLGYGVADGRQAAALSLSVRGSSTEEVQWEWRENGKTRLFASFESFAARLIERSQSPGSTRTHQASRSRQ